MANVKKHDCKNICEQRGLTYIREQNPYVWIKDEHGFMHRFDRTCFARGSSPSLKSVIDDKTDYSLFMVRLRHPDIDDVCSFEDYSYISALTYTTATCKKHGAYNTKPNWLLSRGHHCMMCAEELRTMHKNLGTKEFVIRSKRHFGERYDYSKTVYVNCRKPVTITCKEHGDFSLLAYSHANGEQGCQKCGNHSERNHYARKRENGSFVYIMRFTSEHEVFIKVGLSHNLTRRLSSLKKESGCNIEVIHKEHFKDAGVAWDVEDYLLNAFKDKSYTPQTKFRGATECFTSSCGDEILKVLKSIS